MAGLTPIFDAPRKERFLRFLSDGGSTVADAARAVGVSPQTVMRHRASDADFAQGWQDAIDERVDRLETEARRRAFAKSDTLLIRLLEAERPEKYSPRQKVENRVGGIDGEDLTETQLFSRMAAILNAPAEALPDDDPDDLPDLSEFA